MRTFIKALAVTLLSSLLVTACHMTSQRPRVVDNPIWFALCVNRFDNVTQSSRQEIILLAQYANGQFIKIDEPERINLEAESASVRQSLLRQNRPFTVFYRGKSIGELKNGIIEKSFYDCTSIFVSAYTGQLDFPEKPLVPAQARSGYVHSQEVSYAIQCYLAITSDSPVVTTQPYKQLPQEEASQNDVTALKKWAVQALKRQNAAIKPEEVSVSPISTFLPPGYQRPFYIFTAHSDTEYNCESIAVVAQVAEGQIISLLNEPQSNPSDSWGNGYEFVDALDIDGDGILELVFQVGYYEATGFEIFKLKKGNIVKVLDIILWGC